MDNFGKRNAMLKVLDEIRATGTSISKVISQGQGSLFGDKEMEVAQPPTNISRILSTTEEAPREEILSWERELLGFYLTEHPLSKLTEKLERIVSVKIGEIDLNVFAGKTIKLAGIIASIRKTVTKAKKEDMCFIKLQDLSGTLEVIAFPRTYQAAKDIISPDQIVVISGKLETGEDTPVLIANEITLLESEQDYGNIKTVESLNITLPRQTDRILLSKIYEVLKESPGNTTTYLILPGEDNANRQIPVPFTVSRTVDLESRLEHLGCVILD